MDPAPTAAPATPAGPMPFLARCMEQLIDLSKRNRFLNFRAGKTSAVRIVGERPAEVFRTIHVNGYQMRFLPPKETIVVRPGTIGTEAPPVLEERQRGRNLQTDVSEETLDTILRRIHQQSKSVFEEHGYNALFLALGFLEWTERKPGTTRGPAPAPAPAPAAPDAPPEPPPVPATPEVLRAPVLLVPVILERKTVAAPFILRPDDDDPIVNPALARKLELEYGITLPPLPEDFEGFDPNAWYAACAAAVAGQPGWRLTDACALALFSFAKFAMYRDIEQNVDAFRAEPRLSALGGGAWPAAPPPPAAALDAAPPERTFQVLDADSSQQEAILAARAGSDLVIEGPPGTGKSQTIANLIAELLADGKSVLFVSEKMAALEVVFARLKEAGLGDFCLELHSHKASKRKVAEELRRTLEAHRAAAPVDDAALKELAAVRHKLNQIVEQLHGAVEPLGESPYRAIAYLAARPDLPELKAAVADAAQWTGARLTEQAERVERLTQSLAPVRPRGQHPWRGSSLTDAPYDLTVRLRGLLDALIAAVSGAEAASKALAAAIGAPEGATVDAMSKLEDLGRLLAASPKPDAALIASREWDALSEDASKLLAQGERYRQLRDRLRQDYTDGLFEASLDGPIAAYREYGLKWYRILVGRYRAARAVALSVCRPGHRPDPPRALADLEAARECQQLKAKLSEPRGKTLFGAAWRGPESDWGALRTLADWLVAWRRHVAEGRTTERTAELAAKGMDPKPVDAAGAALQGLRDGWNALRDAARLSPEALWGDPFVSVPAADVAAAARAMLDGMEKLHDWARHQSALVDCEKAGLGAFLKAAFAQQTPVVRLPEAFRCVFYRSWLDAAVRQRPLLKDFDGRAQEELVAKFRELDRRQIDLARRRLANTLLERRPDLGWNASSDSELGILQHEVRKKRAHMPIRRLFERCPHVVRALKPCLMMSPLSVAQFLDPRSFKADVLLFDEASQISPEDAVGAIARAKQIVVVGDSRQLPPTAFFESSLAGPESEEEVQPADLESILDACASRGVPRRRLLWHYRSRHESLIAFSNRHFYDNRLVTFPSVAESVAVEFRFVEGAVYERGTGANALEAKAVAQAVFDQLQREPDRSVGVGTFGVRQQQAILDALEELRAADPSQESRFDTEDPDYCFVKNLETIQGDERDVIIISVGYGRDAGGKVSMNFGPLNQEGGDRRLNVLVTRARHKVVVFSSIRPADLDLSRTNARGVGLLKRYLEFCERGIAALGEAEKRGVEETAPFEAAVAKELEGRGLKVVPRVGCSEYRVDLAVPGDDGRFVLGIEFDGAGHTASRTARDRYRLRRQVLEDRGWRFHRIWALDWWRRPKAEADRAVEAATRAKAEPPMERAEFKAEPAAPKSPTTSPGRMPPAPKAPAPAAAAIPGVVPYARTPFTLRGAPEEFYEAPVKQVLGALADVIKAEGPVHRLEATRQVALQWGVTKALKKVRETVDDAIECGIREGRVTLRDDFLWPAGMESPPVRSRRELPDKDVDFVPVEEIAEAAALVLKKEFRLGRESLADQALKVLGFERPSPRARERADEAVERLIGAQRVEVADGQLKLRS